MSERYMDCNDIFRSGEIAADRAQSSAWIFGTEIDGRLGSYDVTRFSVSFLTFFSHKTAENVETSSSLSFIRQYILFKSIRRQGKKVIIAALCDKISCAFHLASVDIFSSIKVV